MQSKSRLVVIFIGCLLFVACEKFQGTISGKVVYVEDGTEYAAVDAVITKIELKGDKEIVVAKEKTDSIGNYVLNFTAKGSWKIRGWLELDSLVYEGSSDAINIVGTNKEEVNLVLFPTKNAAE
jgi:hypothetical protein